MDKCVRVFFSQPMRELTKDEIISERAIMMDEFRNFLCHELGFDSDVEIIDMNDTFYVPGPMYVGRLWYLGRSIQNLDKANYIVFHNEWSKADGCCVEHNVAINYFKYHLHKVSDHIKEIHFGRE